MNPALGATWHRVRMERQHRRRERPALWFLGWLASLAGGFGAFVLLQRAANADSERLLQPLLFLLGGIAIISTLHIFGSVLTAEAARMHLPLPLDPASRWRLALTEASLATGMPSIALLTATLLTANWQWALFVVCWIPVAWTVGVALASGLSWSFTGSAVRWRALAILAGSSLLFLGTLWLLMTASRPLSPLALLPDAAIVMTLSLGPGARFLGRVMIPISRQIASAPPTTLSVLPRTTRWLAGRLEQQSHPTFAIARKELLTHSRDAFTLLRFMLVIGSVPLAMLLRSRIDPAVPDGTLIVVLVIALAFYGMLELSPSPFGSEGNRLLLALQTPITSGQLLAGKVLGMLLFNLPQAWALTIAASIGIGVSPVGWMPTILTSTVAVTGLCTVLTCASVADIDLNRRVEDRSQALMAEHMPLGIRRMLGLGLTGLVAMASIAILLRTSPGIAFPLICLLQGGSTIIMWRFAARRLTTIRH